MKTILQVTIHNTTDKYNAFQFVHDGHIPIDKTMSIYVGYSPTTIQDYYLLPHLGELHINLYMINCVSDNKHRMLIQELCRIGWVPL